MSSIHVLSSLDLNLLVAFATLHEHQSVTGAANELGVTQSAMSHTLRRLRDMLDDPLFVRAGRRMVATPRADSLIGPVRGHLEGLARSLSEPDGFVPATSRRRFALASVDIFDALVAPRLAQALAERAPSVGLALRPHDRTTIERLDRGELDAAVHPLMPGADSMPAGGLRRRTLLRDGFLVFARAGHPSLQERCASVEAFCEAEHMLVTPGGGPGLVDERLAAQGLARIVRLELHQFSAALAVLQGTDLLLTAPVALGRLAAPGTIRALPCPVPLPQHAVTLLWTERMDSDPGHRWFREQVAEVAVAAAGNHAILGS